MSVVPRGIYRIHIYRDLCKACGVCVSWCPQAVLENDREMYPVATHPELCVNCKACERHCPDFAIEVVPPFPDSEVADVEHLVHAR